MVVGFIGIPMNPTTIRVNTSWGLSWPVVVFTRAMGRPEFTGRHWRTKRRWQPDFAIPLPTRQALPYILLTFLAAAALGTAALAVLKTS
jgi:hypothetical protein